MEPKVEKKYGTDITSIKEAQARISSFIHKTPVLTSESLNAIAGKNLFFKCELFQKGSVLILDCISFSLLIKNVQI